MWGRLIFFRHPRYLNCHYAAQSARKDTPNQQNNIKLAIIFCSRSMAFTIPKGTVLCRKMKMQPRSNTSLCPFLIFF